ncbi:MAG: DUF86 domain-containing protein [Duncaniella sp.]|jgi:uncharacterized protein with HEPN domain|nr:DUF86 domain-containing protein [Muribaculaceae bacterium Isolate-110 (HZI)]
MNDCVNKRLEDILKAISEIEYFYEAKPKRFDYFVSDLFYLRAVQMNIAIIGEAMSRILKEQPGINISSARKIVNTRNYVIHGYDSLREDILWGIVVKDIQVLKSEIQALMA